MHPVAEPSPRRERNAAETQRRLLDAATVEFAAKGFAGARLRAIADAASVQAPLISHYFGDKEGLYEAVLDRALAQASEESFRILGRTTEPRELVEQFVEMTLRFYATNALLMAMLRHEAAGGGSQVAASVLRERNRPVFEALEAQIEKLKREGRIRPEIDARELVLSTMGMAIYPSQEAAMIEAVWPAPPGSPEDELARRKRTIVELVMGGIMPR